MLGTHNVYKQWLVPAYLEIPSEFPMASTCLESSVPNHATAHTRNDDVALFISFLLFFKGIHLFAMLGTPTSTLCATSRLPKPQLAHY
jgi:hypothetical protein